MIEAREEPEHTHRATIKVFSNGDDNTITVQVDMDPDIEGIDIEKLGYLPAAYQLLQEYLIPAIDEAYLAYEYNPMMQAMPPSNSVN